MSTVFNARHSRKRSVYGCLQNSKLTASTQISDTLPDKKVDIATLSAALVAHSEHVNATLGLRFRVALVVCTFFIFFSGPPLTTRQRLLCTRGYTNAEFWPKVDEELANLRAGGSGDLVTCVIALSYLLLH